MKHPHVRYGILFFLLLCAAAFSMAHLLTSGGGEKDVDLKGLFPVRLDGWQGRDLSLDPDTLRLLGTKNVLFRHYEKAGEESVLLCLTLSGGDHRIAHPAEVCYEGQGWEIAANEERVLAFPHGSGQEKGVNYLKILREGKTQEVLVWYSTSSYDTASFIKQKFGMMFGRLFGQSRWSAMVRLSAPRDGRAPERALRSLCNFGAVLMPHVDALHEQLETE